MAVGAMAFILKCVIYSIAVNSEWLHAIEFADLVIPITAFFFVLHGKKSLCLLTKLVTV